MKEEYLPKDEQGRLLHLAEECSEVIKIICKAGRFGITSHHPNDENKITNAHLLLKELDDLEFAVKEVRKDLSKLRLDMR